MGCASSSEVKWIDVCSGNHTAKENQVGIIKLYYFGDYWGRNSVLEFMLDHAGVQVAKEGISLLNFYAMGGKKKYGGIPVAERKDGFFMNETQPMARYIARHNGYYPVNPWEAY